MRRHRAELKVRFKDVDLAGHVNNALFLSYLEEARISFFSEFAPGHDWSKQSMLLAHAELDYLLRIELNDAIHVEVWCSRMGNKSLDLSYEVFKKNGPDGLVLCCKALTTMVGFDLEKDVTTRVPDEWRKELVPYTKAC